MNLGRGRIYPKKYRNILRNKNYRLPVGKFPPINKHRHFSRWGNSSMLDRCPSALALAGLVGALLFAPPVFAQSNPFVLASPVSLADVQRQLVAWLARIRGEDETRNHDTEPNA